MSNIMIIVRILIGNCSLLLAATYLHAGTWAPLVNPFPGQFNGTFELLTDGTVMVQAGFLQKEWYKLTPDMFGSYHNGSWSQLPSMSMGRRFDGTNMLPDGRLMILGGQFEGNTQTNTNTGEIFDPVSNTWIATANFPESIFGDGPAITLDDGTILAGYKSGTQTYIYHPSTNTWTNGATRLINDRARSPWVKLHDGDILAYARIGEPRAQRLDSTTNTWVDSGTVPVALRVDPGSATGPAIVLTDGRVFHLGANSNTAIYTPSGTSAETGTWVAGPILPDGLNAASSSAAILPNGHVLFVASGGIGGGADGPTRLFEFDPAAPIASSLTDATPPIPLANSAAFVSQMVVLPTGEVLVSVPGAAGSGLHIYTPDGAADATWRPTISSVAPIGDELFMLTGTQLTGLSNGSNYAAGGGAETSYPIVRLSSGAGTVYYARTFDWSTSAIATGNTPVTTKFALPPSIPNGLYSLSVIANGIASIPMSFNVGAVPEPTTLALLALAMLLLAGQGHMAR